MYSGGDYGGYGASQECGLVEFQNCELCLGLQVTARRMGVQSDECPPSSLFRLYFGGRGGASTTNGASSDGD